MTSQQDVAKACEQLEIVIVNQAPTHCLVELAEALGQRGHRVRLVTGTRVAQQPLRHASYVRFGDYDARTYPSRVWTWLTFTVRTASYLAGLSADTVVIACTNPPVMPVVAALVAAMRRFAIVARVLDVYPDVIRAVPFFGRRFVAWCYGGLNHWAYARCSVVTTLGEVMAATLGQYVPRTKLAVIPEWNSAPTNEAPPLAGARSAGMLVVASGNVGATHDISPLLAAARILAGSPVEFVVSNSGACRLPEDRDAVGNVRSLGRLPDEEYERLLGDADVAFVSQRPWAERCSFPSRVLGYLAHGVALAAMTRRPSDLADLVDRYGCGVVIDPSEGAEGLARSLRRLHDEGREREAMGAAAVKAATLFNKADWLPALIDLIEQVGAKHRRAAGMKHGS